jgi:type I restriction enzyme S subunit
MELKAGYEQTEVGVIPTDWNLNELAKIGQLTKGKGLLKHEIFPNGSIPAIPYTAIYTDFSEVLNYEKIKWFVENANSSVVVSKPCVLIASSSNMDANTGKATAITGEIPVAVGREVIIFQTQHNASFISYLLSTSRYRKKTLALARGTTIKHVYPATFKNYKICVPGSTEQNAIAEALSDADALIESLDQIIAKKRLIKRGAMQELLTGKRRLPGFGGEWVDVKLGDVADPLQGWSFTGGPFGSNLKSSDYTNEGVRIIQLQNIGDGEFQAESAVFTTKKKADELISCNIYPGEIILSKMGDPVARACLIPALHDRYLMCSDGIRLAVNKRRFNTFFVFSQINAPDFRARANNAGTGSTRKRIGLNELRSLTLSCPEVAEQTAIAAILSDIDTELGSLESRLAKARQIRQGMMQELLTGRIRLL